MATNDKENIIRYAEGELPEEERRQFEADLQKDPSLAAELSLYQELKAELQLRLPRDEQKEALLDTLQGMRQRHFGGGATAQTAGGGVRAAGAPAAAGDKVQGALGAARRIPITRWVTGMVAAASVIFVIVFVWPSGRSHSFDKLGQTEMAATTERGGNADSAMQQAAAYFNNQEFAKALPFLEQSVREDSSNQLALLYCGIAAWHTGAVDEGRKNLEQVYKNSSLLQYEAAFYLALGYATQKDTRAAREWLDKIPDGTPVSDKAKELGRMLK